MPDPPSPLTLVPLLADGSATSRRTVKAALLDLGEAAIPALRAAADGPDPLLRARARQVLLEVRRRRGLARLEALLSDPGAGLEEGLLAIDEVLGASDPALDVAGQLDGWATLVRASLDTGTSAAAAGRALAQVLAGEARFTGAADDFHNSLHVSLTRTIEDRRGLPLTLCAVYALVGRRAGLHVDLLPFPGHVLVLVHGDDSQVILDAFGDGAVLDEAACLARLRRLGVPPSPAWFQPASDVVMITRQLRNLVTSMHRHGRSRAAEELVALLERA